MLLTFRPPHLAISLPVRAERPTAPRSLPPLGTHTACQQLPGGGLPRLLQAQPFVGVGGAACSLLGRTDTEVSAYCMSLLPKPLQQGKWRLWAREGGKGGGQWSWQGWAGQVLSRGQTLLPSRWKEKPEQPVPPWDLGVHQEPRGVILNSLPSPSSTCTLEAFLVPGHSGALISTHSNIS